MRSSLRAGAVRYIEAMRAAGRGIDDPNHHLARFHPVQGRTETLTLPEPHGFNPLIGLGYRPGFDCVVYQQHLPGPGGLSVRAFIVCSDGSNAVCFVTEDEPIELSDGGLDSFPELRMVLEKLMFGRVLVSADHSPLAWLVQASVAAVTGATASSGVDDGEDARWLIDQFMFREVAQRLSAIRAARNPMSTLMPVQRVRESILDALGVLDGLQWSDLDAVTLAPAMQIPSDDAWWWGAQGLVELEYVSMPRMADAVTFLTDKYPQALEALTTTLADFDARVDAGAARQLAGVRQMQGYIRHQFAAALVDGHPGSVVYGYQNEADGTAHVIARHPVPDSADRTGPDFTQVPDLYGADGVLWITQYPSQGMNWWAGFLERDGHSGITSGAADQGAEFGYLLDDPALLAAMRRVLTGEAVREQDRVGVIEWVGRCALFDLVDDIEQGRARETLLAALDDAVAGDPVEPAAGDRKAFDDDMLQRFTDLSIDVLFAQKVADVLLALANLIEDLPEPTDDPLELNVWWEEVAELIDALIDEASWTDYPIDDLSVLWNVPVVEARWWGQEGLAYLQSLHLADANESMLRLAMPVPAATPQMLRRWRQVFARVCPVQDDFIAERARLVAASRGFDNEAADA
ncbi:hypothetical protein SAMN04488550_1413 [Gordonia malaquae]|nr:hypothetical protein SAMN04488550_1413 [Gordonia malaquae]